MEGNVPGPVGQHVFSDLVASAETDPAVMGLVPSGSRAREGMATAHSDHDAYVIVQDGAATGLSEMRKVVIDHLDDETAAIVRRQATRTPEETRGLAALTPEEARG